MTCQEAYIEAVEELGLDASAQDILDYAVDIYEAGNKPIKYFQARELMQEWYES
jgi:hypothetical protein